LTTLPCHSLTLSVSSGQKGQPSISEHIMIADIQTQDTTFIATEATEQFVTVQDLDLMYVGGGTSTGMLF
jgi:hypothetical protein